MSIGRKLAVAATTAVLGLVAGATVFSPVMATAQESTTTTFDDDTAAVADRTARFRSALEELVTNGTITADQADAVAAHLAASLPHPRGHFLGKGAAREILEETAAAIGIEVADLREALVRGQSIAEVATANGVDPQTVIDALVADFNAYVDQAVANGRITEEVAAEKKANAPERISALVNGEFEFRRGFQVIPQTEDDESA